MAKSKYSQTVSLICSLLMMANLVACGKREPTYEFDLVIANGNVLDGSGELWFPADVAIKGDQIVHVGRLEEKGKRARRVIDAKGLTVSESLPALATGLASATTRKALSFRGG